MERVFVRIGIVLILFANWYTESHCQDVDSIENHSIGLEFSTLGINFFNTEFSEKIHDRYFNTGSLHFQFRRYFATFRYLVLQGDIVNDIGTSGLWNDSSAVMFSMPMIELGYTIVAGKKLKYSLAIGGGTSRASTLKIQNEYSDQVYKSNFRSVYTLSSLLEYIPFSVRIKDSFLKRINFATILRGTYFSNFLPSEFNITSSTLQLQANISLRFLW